jgi:Cu+-exporting ATPase
MRHCSRLLPRLDQIVRVVREGQTKRAPIERVADQITAYFVPVVTYIAIADFLIWLGLGLGGVLPQSYLDIEVGGWGTHLSG